MQGSGSMLPCFYRKVMVILCLAFCFFYADANKRKARLNLIRESLRFCASSRLYVTYSIMLVPVFQHFGFEEKDDLFRDIL